MTLLVDTSVWSLAFRKALREPEVAEVRALRAALAGEEIVVTTGFVLQELLQGFNGPRDATAMLRRFSALPIVTPERQDHVDAAALRNRCRRAGVQFGTSDALLAHLCIRYGLTMLTTDRDFDHAAAHCALRVWH